MSRVRKNSRRSPPPPAKPYRLWGLAAMIAGFTGCLIWHLAHLQVIPGNERGYVFLQRQGEALTVRNERLPAYRGLITDRRGELLAVSTQVTSLYADPRSLDLTRLSELAKALDQSPEQLAQRVADAAGKHFMYLARHLPPAQADAVLSLDIDGVAGEPAFQRYYPAGEVAAQVVGFTNIDERGQEGIELAFDSVLTGVPGVKKVLKDRRGHAVKDLEVERAAVSGRDLQLTLDLRLQYLAHKHIKAAVTSQSAAAGSVVMLDATSGEVLAMANYPSFNPNNRARLNPAHLRNRAVTDLYEPGSTMKPFTAAAALASGRYRADTVIDTSPGTYRVGGKTYVDFRNYGAIDLTTIIQKSSQVGISKIAQELDPLDIRNMFAKAGLGQSTGIGFPGEATGLLPDRRRWHPTERAAQAFGHGLSVTPLQLAQAYTAFANEGEMVPVSLLKGAEPMDPVQVMEPAVAADVVEMLKAVTAPGGTATRARTEHYTVAGKTGTAHKVGANGYESDKYLAFFAGMAPADDPRVVIVVLIDEPPAEQYYGGQAAAPVFAELAEGALRLLNVKPDVVNRTANR